METVKISLDRYEKLIEKQVKNEIKLQNLLEELNNDRIYIDELETKVEDLQAKIEYLEASSNDR